MANDMRTRLVTMAKPLEGQDSLLYDSKEQTLSTAEQIVFTTPALTWRSGFSVDLDARRLTQYLGATVRCYGVRGSTRRLVQTGVVTRVDIPIGVIETHGGFERWEVTIQGNVNYNARPIGISYAAWGLDGAGDQQIAFRQVDPRSDYWARMAYTASAPLLLASTTVQPLYIWLRQVFGQLTTATARWVQIHDSAAAPINGAIPVMEVYSAQYVPWYFDCRDFHRTADRNDGFRCANGGIWLALSQTGGSLTLDATAASTAVIEYRA